MAQVDRWKIQLAGRHDFAQRHQVSCSHPCSSVAKVKFDNTMHYACSDIIIYQITKVLKGFCINGFAHRRWNEVWDGGQNDRGLGDGSPQRGGAPAAGLGTEAEEFLN